MEFCKKHQTQKERIICFDCEEGYSFHDCGEDTCCCLNPVNNVVCSTCEGKGGWWSCDYCRNEEQRL